MAQEHRHIQGINTNLRECLLASRQEMQPAASAQTRALTPGEERLTQQMDAMRDLMLAQSAQMARLEAMLREMVVLTGGQEAAIKAAAIARARELCACYELPPRLYAKVASQIRADVVRPSGVRAVRDIPRAEFAQALEQAQGWDKPGAMRKMQREAGKL